MHPKFVEVMVVRVGPFIAASTVIVLGVMTLRTFLG